MTSSEITAMLSRAKGEEKAQLLYALGSMTDSISNDYYGKLAQKPTRNLHYLCNSRCGSVSDYAAGILENVINLLVLFSGSGIMPDGFDEGAWTALNVCSFKASDRLFEQFERIGQYTDKIRKYEMDMHKLMFSKTLQPFLARRASKWWASCGETDFIFALNDMLICGITRNGDDFAQKVSALSEKYPETFARAGFFAEFVRNNSAAFDKFGRKELSDTVLSVFSGVEYDSESGYMLYSPIWYVGNKNAVYHSRVSLGDIDIRWLDLLVDIAMDEKAVCEHFRRRSGILPVSCYRHMSRIMLHVFSPENKAHCDIMRRYFLYTASRYLNEQDFSGLELCGGYSITDILPGALESCLERKAAYNGIWNLFNLCGMSRAEKLLILDISEEYLLNNRERNRKFCDNFIKETELFRERKRPRMIK